MKRLRTGVVVAAFLGLAFGAVLLAVGQSVFPVRMDAGAENVSPAAGAGIVAGVLRLEPQDQPPFPCTPAEFGTLYVQRDLVNYPGWDQFLCHCVPVEGVNATGFWKWVGATNTNCSSFVP
jgi:hypothetical protein